MRVELPEGQILEFPDDSTPDEIKSVVQKSFGGTISEQQPPAHPGIQTPSVPSPEDVEAGKESLVSAVKKEAPQVVGGIAGGLLAGSAGATFAPVIAAVGLGAGAGEAFKQMGQHISGSLDAPKTSIDAAKRIGKAAVTEAGWETFGGLFARGMGKILAPFRKTVDPVLDEAAKRFSDKIQPVLLPAELTESRILGVLQNVSEASLIGGGSIAKFKAKRAKFLDDFADGIIDQFGQRTSPDDLGNLFVTAIEAKRKVHSEAAGVLYNNVSELVNKHTRKATRKIETPTGPQFITEEVGGIGIPTSSIKQFASKVRIKVGELGSIEAKNAGDDLMDAVRELPDEIGFEAAKELRSRLISRVDEFSVLNKKAPAIGKAKKLIGLLDKTITKSLNKLPNDEALKAWREANRFYKHGQEKFNNTFLRRMIKLADDTGTGAESIAPAVFRPNQITKVRKVKRALGEGSNEWRKMKGFFIQHLMSKATDIDGKVVGKKLLNSMSGKPNSFGYPMMSEILSGPQLREIERFGRVLRATQNKQAEGTGRMVIQLMQFGAVGMIASGNMEAQAVSVLLAPPVLSKLMLNPRTAKLLTKGISTPAGTKAAAGLLARITAAAERINDKSGE